MSLNYKAFSVSGLEGLGFIFLFINFFFYGGFTVECLMQFTI